MVPLVTQKGILYLAKKMGVIPDLERQRELRA